MTLPRHVPSSFKSAVNDFASALKTNFGLSIPANPEDQLKAPVQNLLSSVTRNVESRSEAQIQEIGGRPDIGVLVKKLLCGYVELKAPGKGARVWRFRGADKDQWAKFKFRQGLKSRILDGRQSKRIGGSSTTTACTTAPYRILLVQASTVRDLVEQSNRCEIDLAFS